MPRRSDIRSILVIGSGPIVIGQAGEFDYSGTQAVRALKDEGFRVILVNSNPATIMTDPDFSDAVYIEPLSPHMVEKIIEKERPDAVLPTMGGQTALNVALSLEERGVFKRYGIELIGANIEAIKTAEDRELFRRAMEEIGLSSARSGLARSTEEAFEIAKDIGFPLVLRPSRTLGGTGGGFVESIDSLKEKVEYALSCSPNREVLIEESLVGWKEIELEVMRDTNDNVVIICGIENIDPMGVHTGDSITVAPIQTLTDKEYQLLRDAAIRVIRRIGVETGGSNVQFALNPADGRCIVIEMNPRVSRSSALASKATGFPIAKIAAKLAVGYTLDEINNDITQSTPACFEPSIDYVVVKVPRFNFEKFPNADTVLGTQMKSVGEVLAFGRSFSEAMCKALSSIEVDSYGFDGAKKGFEFWSKEALEELCTVPGPFRLWGVGEALRSGISVQRLYELSKIDPWFLSEIESIIHLEKYLTGRALSSLNGETLFLCKQKGLSDARIAAVTGTTEDDVTTTRTRFGVKPIFRAVDTCAGEFEASTNYLYSCYDGTPSYSDASLATYRESFAAKERRSVIILGSGPNRIGQGIEFDYCCVHGILAAQELGYEAVMLNCNPETVSTDYDIGDRLYFEPVTLESVLSVVERENPLGVIVQLGGQTPLKLGSALAARGVPLLGTSMESIDSAEDREKFASLVASLGLQQPEGAIARSVEEALIAGRRLGFPLMIRPSFVLGGRAMKVVYSMDDIARFINESVSVSFERPILLDRFLSHAVEVDVDALSDGTEVLISGVMEHIERAGIHSGDSSCSLPPHTLPVSLVEEIKRQTRSLARALGVRGFLNVQFAADIDSLHSDPKKALYIIEANPRASRTVPFVSKATGVSWAKLATRLMLGESIKDLKVSEPTRYSYFAVKESVFPFQKFTGADPILGPEMKSTGEVMGIDSTFGGAFARAQSGAGVYLPASGRVFLSVRDTDKRECVPLASKLIELGFSLCATHGTAHYLTSQGIVVERVNKVREGSPHIVDNIIEGSIAMVVNTPEGGGLYLDSRSIRLAASDKHVPLFTTVAGAFAGVLALEEVVSRGGMTSVHSLKEFHARTKNPE
jgi:carbamoyl-phosphate synthase large subunit